MLRRQVGGATFWQYAGAVLITPVTAAVDLAGLGALIVLALEVDSDCE